MDLSTLQKNPVSGKPNVNIQAQQLASRMDPNKIIMTDMMKRGMGDQAIPFILQLTQEAGTPKVRIVRHNNTLGVLSREGEHQGILSIFTADDPIRTQENVNYIYHALKAGGYKHLMVHVDNPNDSKMHEVAGKSVGGQMTIHKLPTDGFMIDWRL